MLYVDIELGALNIALKWYQNNKYTIIFNVYHDERYIFSVLAKYIFRKYPPLEISMYEMYFIHFYTIHLC